MPIIHRQLVGPFKVTTFAIFEQTAKGVFSLNWDEGPKYNMTPIMSDKTTVFKFQKETVAEVEVVDGYNGVLEFSGRQLPITLVTASAKDLAEARAEAEFRARAEAESRTRAEMALTIPGTCGISGCNPSSITCPPIGYPNATKPKCESGNLICVNPE